jgi:hypothetical protein
MNKTKISFGPVIITFLAFGIPLYMISKYGFMVYAQKSLENRINNRQKLASMVIDY